MGYDSTNYLLANVKRQAVEHFLELLRYKRIPGKRADQASQFYFFDAADYRHYDGVRAVLRTTDDGRLEVDIHTSAFHSKEDCAFQNQTMRELRDRFGGHFISDYGKNRLIHFKGIDRCPADAGCLLAYSQLGQNLIRARLYLDHRKFDGEQWKSMGVHEFLDSINPHVLSNNLLVPYLVATLEDYFKSTYVALLKYSNNKRQILKGLRLANDALAYIADGTMQLEEAAANSISFQNMGRICEHFRNIDRKLDLAGVLRKPYRRRRENLYETLCRLIETRHAFIHQTTIYIDYSDDHLIKDLYSLEEAVTRVYKFLLKTYGWKYEPWWSLGREPKKKAV